ncbi:MAG: DUF2231 domain-containing protein [Actinomycetota bacterium]
MARIFSLKPALTYRGRKFKGLRGWAGKPTHPPLTDFPVVAYLLAGIFDAVSFFADGRVSTDMFRASTYVIVAGAIVSLPTAATGFWDWLKSTSPRTQAWRTANAHMAAMVLVTVIVVVDIIIRIGQWDDGGVSGAVFTLSAVAALLVSIGAVYGGSLVYDYGFNVETAGDSPVWHESEIDVLPGQK